MNERGSSSNQYVELCGDVSAYCREVVRPSALARDRDASFPKDLTGALRDMGLFKAYIPKEFGGFGFSMYEACKLYFELGRHSLDLPWASSLGVSAVVGVDLLSQFGDSRLQKEIFERSSQEVVHLCIANSERGAGTNPMLMQSSIVEHGSSYAMTVKKDCATNAPIADYFFVSAKHKIGDRPSIDVFCLPKNEVKSKPFHQEMAGFRTSPTGTAEVDTKDFAFEDHVIGKVGSGLHLFRRCFDVERIMISAIIAGILQGLEDSAIAVIKEKEKHNRQFSERQYIQQKLLVTFSAKEKIWSLIERVALGKLSESAQLLGLMKWMAIQDGLTGTLAYLELLGQDAMLSSNHAQKVVRDMLAVRFIGGTMELQKMSIFKDFPIESELAMPVTKKTGS